MKTGISAAIQRFIEQNIVCDDPLPELSRLDKKDLPPMQGQARSAVAGLPVEPLPPLPAPHAGYDQHPQRLRRRSPAPNATTTPDGGI